MTERGETARVPAGAAWPGLPTGGDGMAILAGRIGQSLIEAGFSLHHCDRSDPLHPLGGVCLTLVPPSRGDEPAGVCVSWTTHNLLLFDDHRWASHSLTVHVMNGALGKILRTLGWDAEPFGTGGAWIIPLPEGHDAEGARR